MLSLLLKILTKGEMKFWDKYLPKESLKRQIKSFQALSKVGSNLNKSSISAWILTTRLMILLSQHLTSSLKIKLWMFSTLLTITSYMRKWNFRMSLIFPRCQKSRYPSTHSFRLSCQLMRTLWIFSWKRFCLHKMMINLPQLSKSWSTCHSLQKMIFQRPLSIS